MKKRLGVSLLVLFVSVAFLMASGAEETSASSKGSIGLSVSTQNNPFFVTLVEGAEEQAKALDLDLTVVDAGDDVVKQINDIDDLVSKNVKVIIVNPVDSDAVAPAVRLAKAAGIKVIAVDRAVNGESVSCQIASDNVMGARLGGEYMVKLIGDGAKVAELEGVLGASATIDRGEGFHQAANAANFDIVARQTANFNRAEGLNVTENILQAHPDIVGIFAHNDEMALGAAKAVASSGKDIVIVGFDATDDGLAAVKDGSMAGTVAQQPGLMGKQAVDVALDLINGKTVPASLPVEVALITE